MGRLALLLRLSLRNVRRQARRSTLTAAAMAVGLALLVLTRAIADGAHEDWITAGVRLGSGHIAIENAAYRTEPGLKHRLDGAARRAIETRLASPALAPRIATAVPRLAIDGLARSPTSAAPVSVVGVDPEREQTFSTLATHMSDGRYLQPDDRLAAVVGTGLAKQLHLVVGDRLVLSAQDAGGGIADQLVRVVGIFHSGVPEVDQGLIHVPLATLQGAVGVGDDITNIALMLKRDNDTRPFAADLSRALGGDTARIAVLPWQQAMPELDAAIHLDDFGDWLFVGILLAIVALAIVNAVLMSVLQRVREFGILEAMGLTSGQVGALVFTEGVFLTAVAGITGIILGVGGTWLFFRHGLDLSSLWNSDITMSGVVMDPVIVPKFRAVQVLQSLAWTAAVGVLASIYPAWRATRIEIAEAMTFE